MGMNQFNILVASIVSSLKAGNADSVIDASEKAIKQFGNNPALYDYYAKGLALKGRFQAAADAQQKAIELGGAEISRVLFLGEILLQKGEVQTAADVFQQVIKQVDDSIPAWLGLGHCLLVSADFARAEKCYGKVLEKDSDNSQAKTKLAMCRFKLGDALRAVGLLKQVKKAGDTTPETDFFLAEALRYSSRLEEAEDIFLSLLSNTQWKRRAERGLVTIWLSLERFDEASELLGKLLADEPGDTELLSYKVRVLMVEGKRDESIRLIRELLDAGDENPVLWEMYADQINSPFEEKYLNSLLKLRDKRLLAHEMRGAARCNFALARHFVAASDFSAELECLASANQILAELEPFDSAGHARAVKQLRGNYTSQRIEELSGEGADFEPVFILCPPRSGSTLLEQALARHSSFEAGGEKPFADHAWYELTGGRSVLTTQLGWHERLSPSSLQKFREVYLGKVKDAGLNPSNIMIHKGISGHKFAGLLKAAFPKARFIELHRDPMDVAFGCYKQDFESQPFAHTFEGCAQEISLFKDNMHWWRAQIENSIYRVDYSHLVTSFEQCLRSVLDWLGLHWEESCLDFSVESKVGTASASQVRQGLFTEGVGRWKRYGDLLSPLQKALDEVGVALE
tara:strand:- start:502 stop:2388 length:1887 start_codon:yes stop_codon:yes gene_type:complete